MCSQMIAAFQVSMNGDGIILGEIVDLAIVVSISRLVRGGFVSPLQGESIQVLSI